MKRGRRAGPGALSRTSIAAVLACACTLLAAGAARSQVEDLVSIDPIQPSEAGGCYPGTPGPDATMFIRFAPGVSQCDFGDPFDDFCLSRREFPADGANGRAVSFGDMALLRPSVTGDGFATLFVRNLDLCLMVTDQLQQDICYDLPGPNGSFVHGIGVAPQGTLLGLIPRDLNAINVPANALQIFGLGAFPSLTLLATFPFVAPALYPETVDFMARGRWLIFDASTSPNPGGPWGLYLIDRFSGELRTLAAPLAGYQLRNPVFGQTSDDVISFEAVSTTSVQSTVLTANLLTGDVRKIAEINLTAAIPTFNGDDTAIVFNREDPGVVSSVSLRERSLLADRITAVGAERSHLLDGGFATIYRRGAFDDAATPCPEPGTPSGLVISTLALAGVARRRAGV